MPGQDQYYQKHIFCCDNERPAGHPRGCCKERGGETLRNYLKARVKEEGIEGVRVNKAGCLDRCEMGAVMVIYPEGTWYTFASKEDVEEIIESHLKKGTPVDRLLLKTDQKELTPQQAENRALHFAS
jgi:(2Fe-2S) ferredoxin